MQDTRLKSLKIVERKIEINNKMKKKKIDHRLIDLIAKNYIRDLRKQN